MKSKQFINSSNTEKVDIKSYLFQSLVIVISILVVYFGLNLLHPFSLNQHPFQFYLIVVVLSAWIGGLRFGVLSIGCIVMLYLVDPLGITQLDPQTSSERAISLGLFVVEASVISFIIYHLRLTRKNLLRNLTENQKRFAIALEQANISVYTNSRDLIYTWIFNPRSDFSVKDIIGKRDEDILPIEEVKELIDLKKTVLKTGIGRQERIATTINGTHCVFSVTIKPVFDQNGEIIELVGATLDVTEIEETQSALRKSRDLQNIVFRSIQVGTWSIDTGDQSVIFDTASYDLFQFDPEVDLTLKDVFQRVHPDDRENVIKAYEVATTDASGIFDVELRLVLPDGTIRWITTKGQSLSHSDADDVGRLIGIIIDNTHQKQMQTLLQTSEERYRSLFQSIDEGFAICEMLVDDAGQPCNYKFIEVNAKFEEHTGLQDATGKTALELVPDLESFWIETYGHVALEREPRRFEQKSDVMNRWFDVYAFPVEQPSEKKFAIIFKDITASKEAQEQLQQSEQWLRQAKIAANIGIYDYDVVNDSIQWDKRTRSIWGVGENEPLTYESFLEGIHPEDRDYTDQHVQKSLDPDGTGEYYVEYRVINRKDHVTRWILAIGQAIFENGQAVKLIGTVQDITDRKLTEKRNLLLQQLGVALSRAMTQKDVADIVVQYVMNNLETSSCAIIIQIDDENLKILDYRGYDREKIEDYTIIPLNHHSSPVAMAIREEQTFWLRSREERKAIFKEKPKVTPESQQAWATIPFKIDGEFIGAIVFGFDEHQEFDEAERIFMSTLTGYSAQALQRASLTEQIEKLATQHERERLSRDLHDSVQQILFASSTRAEALPRLWQNNLTRAEKYTNEVVTLNRAALAEMRSLLLEMRPEAIAKTPFKKLLENLSTGLHGHMSVDVSLSYSGPDRLHFEKQVHVELYRLCQEIFNNIIKHSQATTIDIDAVYADEEFSLVIKDNGIGFDMSQINAGFGLHTMHERADTIGAVLTIQSQPNTGTEIAIQWKPEEHEEADTNSQFA